MPAGTNKDGFMVGSPVTSGADSMDIMVDLGARRAGGPGIVDIGDPNRLLMHSIGQMLPEAERQLGHQSIG